MEAETGVYQLLSTNAELTGEISDRIYPVTLPQTVLAPAVVLSQLDEQESPAKDGPVSDGWTFQVTTIGTTNMEARAISRLVKKALNWKTQEITGGTVRTRFDDEVSASWDDQQLYFQIVQEYRARKAK